jgi:predicted ArsR family transcriptional regulator
MSDLFDWALSRRADPGTSYEAARSMDEHLPYLEAAVLKELQLAGETGRTLDELSDALSLDKVTVSPRLRPLCDKGLALQSDQKRLGKAGRNQTVWLIKGSNA